MKLPIFSRLIIGYLIIFVLAMAMTTYTIAQLRQLEKATHCNIEVLWLMCKLRPDFKTIADFRKDNTKALKRVCRDFTVLCKKLQLFGCELIAIDGSKFSAVNSDNKSYTKNKIQKIIQKIDQAIDSYLETLDNEDQTEKAVKACSQKELKEKIEERKALVEHPFAIF